jgi:hypothetical protein
VTRNLSLIRHQHRSLVHTARTLKGGLRLPSPVPTTPACIPCSSPSPSGLLEPQSYYNSAPPNSEKILHGPITYVSFFPYPPTVLLFQTFQPRQPRGNGAFQPRNGCLSLQTYEGNTSITSVVGPEEKLKCNLRNMPGVQKKVWETPEFVREVIADCRCSQPPADHGRGAMWKLLCLCHVSMVGSANHCRWV